MKKALSTILWVMIALIGAWAYVTLAVRRGEPINSAYILLAAICSYTIGYRFYSKWVAARVLALDDRRATPCEVHEDGRDFVKTNKWIVFGHHFAAISGPGPLVGPVLAAQFGYLPGTLWILIGVVLGGAVQDFVILFASMRRDGKSLAQMVREELNKTAGVIGVIAILSIMIILLAVLALVVVNALADSPWGIFTVAATIPIAMLMGGYLRWVRAGKVMEASFFGVVLLLLAVWGGQFAHDYVQQQWNSAPESMRTAFSQTGKWTGPFSDYWAIILFKHGAKPLAWSVIIYAFAASVLPVWLLLAPRDYLSTFMKLGTIFLLALGVLLVLPELKMPAVTKFIDGTGPVVPGKLFPFCFITIACGAISGFHTLISSGITPKIITRESYARPVGYGAMLLESLVAIMAMIAACTLEPGVYLAMNIKAPGADAAAVATATVAKVNSFGPEFALSADRMTELAQDVKEESLYGRTGGAATLAVGMANLFAKVVGNKWLGIWYHFALMFEALFILTTLDAGTRVGRYLLQDALGHVWKPLGDVKNILSNLIASGLVVGLWGYFLIAAVHDPDGGIKALWPIFGIANQLLAATALCLATTVILKMALRTATNTDAGAPRRSPALAFVTLVPLLWLLAVTGTAAVQKIFHVETDPKRPKIGFWQLAKVAESEVPALQKAADDAIRLLPTGTNVGMQIKEPKTELEQAIVKAQGAAAAVRSAKARVFNNRLDAIVTGFFLVLVVAIFLISAREWLSLIAGWKLAQLRETEPTWLPDYAASEGGTGKTLGLFTLLFALAKHLAGEDAIERAQRDACACCAPAQVNLLADSPSIPSDKGEAYARVAEQRFNGINRCC